MCLIIDTNSWHKFLAEKSSGPDHFADAQPVRQWLQGRGKLGYSRETLAEMPKNAKTRMADYHRGGQVRLVQPREIGSCNDADRDYAARRRAARPNDLHILDLAATLAMHKASQGRHRVTLWTDDARLIADFKAAGFGKIYRNKGHRHILDQTECR